MAKAELVIKNAVIIGKVVRFCRNFIIFTIPKIKFQLPKSMKMGVHGGGKIAGHSGTDFKHRQGFKLRRKNLWYQQRIGKAVNKNEKEVSLKKSPIIKTSNRFQTHPLERLLKISLAFITVGFIATIIIFTQHYGYFIDPFFYSKQGKPITIKAAQEKQIEINTHAFYTNLKEAEWHLEAGYFDETQSSLVRALKIYPHDAKANLLMTELLVRRCVTEERSCEEAAAYLKAMKKLKGVDGSELNYLQRVYDDQVND